MHAHVYRQPVTIFQGCMNLGDWPRDTGKLRVPACWARKGPVVRAKATLPFQRRCEDSSLGQPRARILPSP